MEQVEIFGQTLTKNLQEVIVGKQSAIKLIVAGLLCQGHILIEDVPGVGKTILARSLARSIGSTFGRLQFTPDMLPSDVTGVSIYDQSTKAFKFREGPVFSQILLVDEINRATPKTQAALLEAMEERQVTVDGQTHPLPNPFLVLATQNPIEYEGTFPLPEAQLDRFLLRVRLGYPSMTDEVRVLDNQKIRHPLETLEAVVSPDDILRIANLVKQVHLADMIKQYIVELVNRTRHNPDIYLGASPRGSLGLYRTGQALAALAGRDYVLPDDIKEAAVPILAHRVIIGSAARLRELSAEKIIEEILASVPVPGGDQALFRA